MPRVSPPASEAGFGYDFSPVTIHFGAQAAESSRAVNARAYTVGRDIVFGDGRYAPKTTTGRELLAHELTHTIQQTTRTQKTPPLSPNNTLEAPANTVSRGVARGLSTASIQSSSGIGLARAERSAHYLNDEELALEISAVNDRLLERGNYSGREEDEKYYKELMDVIARPNRAGLEAISSELDRPRSLKGAHYRNDEELAREISAVNDRLFERRSYSGREEYSGRKEDETYYEELMDEITRPNRAGFEAISSELDRPRSLKGSVDPSFENISDIKEEIKRIRTWLKANPEIPEKEHLELQLETYKNVLRERRKRWKRWKRKHKKLYKHLSDLEIEKRIMVRRQEVLTNPQSHKIKKSLKWLKAENKKRLAARGIEKDFGGFRENAEAVDAEIISRERHKPSPPWQYDAFLDKTKSWSEEERKEAYGLVEWWLNLESQGIRRSEIQDKINSYLLAQLETILRIKDIQAQEYYKKNPPGSLDKVFFDVSEPYFQKKSSHGYVVMREFRQWLRYRRRYKKTLAYEEVVQKYEKFREEQSGIFNRRLKALGGLSLLSGAVPSGRIPLKPVPAAPKVPIESGKLAKAAGKPGPPKGSEVRPPKVTIKSGKLAKATGKVEPLTPKAEPKGIFFRMGKLASGKGLIHRLAREIQKGAARIQEEFQNPGGLLGAKSERPAIVQPGVRDSLPPPPSSAQAGRQTPVSRSTPAPKQTSQTSQTPPTRSTQPPSQATDTQHLTRAPKGAKPSTRTAGTSSTSPASQTARPKPPESTTRTAPQERSAEAPPKVSTTIVAGQTALPKEGVEKKAAEPAAAVKLGLEALKDIPELKQAVVSSKTVLIDGKTTLKDIANENPEYLRDLWDDYKAGRARKGKKKIKTKDFGTYVKRRQSSGARSRAGELGEAWTRGRQPDEIIALAPKEKTTTRGIDQISYNKKTDRIKLEDNKAFKAGRSVGKVSALEENLWEGLELAIDDIELYAGQQGVPPDIKNRVLPRLRAAKDDIEKYLRAKGIRLQAKGRSPADKKKLQSIRVQQDFDKIVDRHGIDRVVTTSSGGKGVKITSKLKKKGFKQQ
jgi:hypothetical protein